MNVQTITFTIGDRVRVPCRFGESGTITEINHSYPNPYGVKFEKMNMTLFYNVNELQPMEPNEKGFSWFRM